MSCDTKIEEYIETLDKNKILIETQFANIEKYLKKTEEINYSDFVNILSTFNTINIQYEQLCEDLASFLAIFKKKEEQQFRIYKTEELIELIEKEVAKFDKK